MGKSRRPQSGRSQFSTHRARSDKTGKATIRVITQNPLMPLQVHILVASGDHKNGADVLITD